MPTELGVRELRANLATILRQVESGAIIRITAHGKPIAELHPPASTTQAPRQPGALRGRITMSPDFDSVHEE